jgi:hypothetical protein
LKILTIMSYTKHALNSKPINSSTKALSDQEKFAMCLRQARRIVALKRGEVPEGFEARMSWVAAVIAVGGAVYGGVQANKAKKDAAGQAGAAAKANQLPKYDPPDMPGFIPIDLPGMLNLSIKGDQEAYARSDTDFRARHKRTLEAEKIFEQRMLDEQKGESELSPQLQSEMMRAGLAGALESFGDTPGTLTPGSAGEADVARHLGLGIMDFQDRNRDNRMESLRMAEEIFPRRAIGYGGGDLASLLASNNEGENNFNQANYAAEVGAYNNNYQIGSQNRATNQQAKNAAAQAEAQADAAQAQMISQALTGLSKSYGTYQAGKTGVAGGGSTSTSMAALPPGAVSGYTYYPSVGYKRT